MKKETTTKKAKPVVEKPVVEKSKAEKPQKESKQVATKAPQNIYEALFAFQGEKVSIPRNGTGKARDVTYKYATLDDTLTAVMPMLQKYGMALMQIMDGTSLITELIHVSSGTKISGSLPLGSPTSSQDLGARITYLRRYAIVAVLGLLLEDDIDGKQVGTDTATPAPQAVNPASHQPEAEKNQAEFGVFGEQNPKKEPVQPAAATPKQPESDQYTLPLNNPSTLPLTVTSEPFKKAKGAVESCVTIEALDLLRAQIKGSVKLTDDEKLSLAEVVKAKETELDGTIHRD